MASLVTAVSVSSYAMPSAVAVQLALLRQERPGMLAVADDLSERSEAVRAVTEAAGAVWLPNKERLGHAAGWLSSAYKSLLWAKGAGADVLLLISQRFWVTQPGWVDACAEQLRANRRHVCCDKSGVDVAGYRYVYTRLIFFDLARWTDAKIASLYPVPVSGPAEQWLYQRWHPNVTACPLPSLPSVCYYSHTLEEHQAVAASVGVTLGEDFTMTCFRDRDDYLPG